MLETLASPAAEGYTILGLEGVPPESLGVDTARNGNPNINIINGDGKTNGNGKTDGDGNVKTNANGSDNHNAVRPHLLAAVSEVVAQRAFKTERRTKVTDNNKRKGKTAPRKGLFANVTLPITFLTLAEYRSRVGEQQYQLETFSS